MDLNPQFEDLETISTLGFRGEALCSISFVSHMAVTTMARDAQYGFRVTYKVGPAGGGWERQRAGRRLRGVEAAAQAGSVAAGRADCAVAPQALWACHKTCCRSEWSSGASVWMDHRIVRWRLPAPSRWRRCPAPPSP